MNKKSLYYLDITIVR